MGDAAVNSRSKPRGGTRTSPRKDSAARGETKPMTTVLDEETASALTLFNTYLIADREQQAHERAVRKAENAKDEAAARLRKLNERRAPAEEVAAAETAYRQSAEALRQVRAGKGATSPDKDVDNPDEDGAEEAEASTDKADEADEAEASTDKADEAEAGTDTDAESDSADGAADADDADDADN